MIEGEKIRQEISEQDYRNIQMLSSSDLRLFNTDRKKFYKEKILLEPKIEEYNRSLMIGNLVHLFLLRPQDFDNTYLMSTCSNPPTGMVLAFTESLYRHSVANMEEDGSIRNFTELLKAAYEESGFKITLEAVLKKFKETGEDYYNEQLEAKRQNLEILCLEDVNIATKIVEIVKGDQFVGEYFNNIDFCELKVEGFDVDGMEMKAMLDKLLIDREHETLQLLDVKVVYDNQDFRYSYYLKRQAYIQAYIYQQAIKSGKLDLGFDYKGWTILSPIFLAVDSGCYYAPVRYDVGLKGLEMAYNGFEENGRKYPGVKSTLEEIKWCQDTGIWNRSKQAYENKGIINL